jgi:hypothetical protein
LRSPRKTLAERIRANGSDAQRFVDMTARVRVYRRNESGRAAPAEWMGFAYGGVWDTWRRTYVKLGTPFELKVHPGQARLIEAFDEPAAKRVLALGSQGGGKTEAVITAAVLLALWHPGKTGGIVAPTRGRIKVVWRKFLKTIPVRWIRAIRPGDNEIVLVTGSIIQFFAAKRQSKTSGAPFAGNDWWWAIEDEQQDLDQDSLEEVDARGRINADFRVFSSATNEPYGEFQRRIQEYSGSPHHKVLRFTGPENSFTALAFWENLKATWSEEAYSRKILCEDIPVDGRVYPAFSHAESIASRPALSLVGSSANITPRLTQEKYHQTYEYVVGVDFGLRVTASVIMQCYRPPPQWGAPMERQWWILDEVVTEHKTTDWHASALLERFNGDPTKFVAITGQDSNSTNPERSDFVLFKKRSINIVRASYGKKLYVRHRYSMMNALLHAADGRRRLMVDCDANRKVKAARTVDSLALLMLGANDKAETYGKGTKGGEDRTHYTDAVGYGLFPFEQFRGTPPALGEDETTNDGTRTARGRRG